MQIVNYGAYLRAVEGAGPYSTEFYNHQPNFNTKNPIAAKPHNNFSFFIFKFSVFIFHRPAHRRPPTPRRRGKDTQNFTFIFCDLYGLYDFVDYVNIMS